MRLFDTHCHFDFAPFSAEFDEHVRCANAAGVERFVIPSIGPSNWQRLKQLSKDYSQIYYAVGLHPFFLDGESDNYREQLELQLGARTNKCVAVGECGLDALIDADSQRQEKVLVLQIELAKAYRLPLILHARKSHNRLLQLLKQHRFFSGGVLHGFAGSYQQAMQFVEMGFYIGVGGVITYPRANKTRQAVAELPIENLVLETDSPDMPINGYQGKPNHPKMLGQVLSCLSSLKEMSEQTVAENVWKNSHAAFGICE